MAEQINLYSELQQILNEDLAIPEKIIWAMIFNLTRFIFAILTVLTLKILL